MIRAHPAIAEDEDSAPGRHRVRSGAAELIDRRFESAIPIGAREKRRKGYRAKFRVGHAGQGGDRPLGHYRLRDANLLRVLVSLLQQIALRAEVHCE